MKSVIRILLFISKVPDGIVSAESLNKYIGDGYHSRIQQLVGGHWIEQASCRQVGSFDDCFYFEPTAYKLTVNGKDRVAAYRSRQKRLRKKNANKNKQAAREKHQKKMDRRQSLRDQLLIAAISSVLTLAIEHYQEIINGFCKAFVLLAEQFR